MTTRKHIPVEKNHGKSSDRSQGIPKEAFVIRSQAFLDGAAFGEVLCLGEVMARGAQGLQGPLTDTTLLQFTRFILPIEGNSVSPQQGANDPRYNAGALFGWLQACRRFNLRHGTVPEEVAHLTFEHASVQKGYWSGLYQCWEFPLADSDLTAFLVRELSPQMIDTLIAHGVIGPGEDPDGPWKLYSKEQAVGYVSGVILGLLEAWPVTEHLVPESPEESQQGAEQEARSRAIRAEHGLTTKEDQRVALMLGDIRIAAASMRLFPIGRQYVSPYTVGVLSILLEQLAGGGLHASVFDPEVTDALRDLLRAIKQAAQR